VLLLIPLDAGYYAVLRYRLGHHGIPLGPAAVAVASLLVLAPILFPLVILLFPDGTRSGYRSWVIRCSADAGRAESTASS
jgi:hypothetical protein